MIFLKKIFVILSLLLIGTIPLKAGAMNVSAQSAVLIENSTGRILFEKNAYSKMPMASTTKIMTAICAIENLDTEKLIVVDDRAVGIEGSSIYLAKNEEITVLDLLYGMMLNSGNDAATALAIEARGSVEDFARLMTDTAQRIGAKSTQFTNACGLYEDNHYTTAYDLALITSYGLKNELFARIVSTDEKTISNGEKGYPRVLKNHNKLLRMYEGCIGVKTGYTKKCGRCLVSSAERDAVSLTCVTLNAPDDWNDHINMLDYGFSKVKKRHLASAGDYCRTVTVSGSDEKECKILFKDSLSFIDFGTESKTEIKYDLQKSLKAPIKKGEKVGEAHVFLEGDIVASSDLVAEGEALATPKKTFLSAFSDNIKWFLGLYNGL